MKTNGKLFRTLALVLAGLALLIGTIRSAAPTGTPEASATADAPLSTTNVAPVTTASTDTVSANNPPAPTPAPEVRLSKGAAEIAKIAQAGLGEDVMLAYVANVNSGFNLGSDQILYLNDLGVSGTVVKSMIQRDAALKAASDNALAALTPPAPNPTIPNPANTGQIPSPPQMDNVAPGNPPYDTGDNANVPVADADYFYNSLAPYGNWIFVAGAGVCWQPTVCLINRDWRPYGDRGRWLYSDCGWYWQSDYSWGWAAFHYGRWFNDASRGWVWAPDHVWGPAWVSWRQSADYCGWAPLPPAAHFLPGVGFTYANHAVNASFEFGLQPEQYTFIPVARLSDYSPARYAAPAWQTQELHARTALANHFVVQNNRVVNQNIDPQTVATLARTEIRHAEILEVPGEANKPVQPERLTRRSGSMVILTPQLPAPTFHRTSTTISPGGSRAPFAPSGNTGQPRSSFNPPQSPAPAFASAPPAARSETYPPGSLVFSGRGDANNPPPANTARLPNTAYSAPSYVSPGAPQAVRQDSSRPSAGFNFNGNFNRPNFNEHFEIQAAATPAQTTYEMPAQTTYVIPGHFTVSQQMSAPRYNGGGAPAAATDEGRSDAAQSPDQSRFRSDNASAPFHQRFEPSSEPVVQREFHQDVPSVERAAAAQHFAPAAPVPSSPQPASSSSSSSGKR